MTYPWERRPVTKYLKHGLRVGSIVIFYLDGTVDNGKAVTVTRVIDEYETLELEVIVQRSDHKETAKVIAKRASILLSDPRPPSTWDFVV